MEDPPPFLLSSFDHSFKPPHECGDGRCRDLFPEFLYIVVIPAAVVVFILFVMLSCLCVCCSVKRIRKSRAAAVSEEQLATYEAVRRASAGVRRMSHTNNTPLLGSRSGSLSLVRDQRHRRGRARDSCHSAPGTLQRRHRDPDWRNTPPPPPPPPAYGMPPEYPLADDDAFLEPDIPLQDFNLEEREPHHGHRRQRPYSAANGYTTH